MFTNDKIKYIFLMDLIVICVLFSFNLFLIVEASDKRESKAEMIYSESEIMYLSQAEPVKIVIGENALPFEGIDENGEVNGILKDVLGRINEFSGLEFELISEKNYNDKIKWKEEDIPLVITSEFREGYSNKHRKSVPYLSTSTVLIGYNTNVLKKKNVKIGILPWTENTKDDTYEIIKDSIFTNYNTLDQAYRDLLTKKIDGMVVSTYAVMNLMIQDSRLILLKPIDELINFSFVFSDSVSNELISILDKCILSITDAEKSYYMLSYTTKIDKLQKIIRIMTTLIIVILALFVLVLFLYMFIKSRKKNI